MSDNIEIQVKIESVDKENNQIIFKPYSPEFKNKIEDYPFIAADMTSFDLSRDINEQLLNRTMPYIKEILFKEKNEKFLKILNDQNIEANTVLSKQINITELFPPKEPTPVQPQSLPEISVLKSTDIFSVVK